MQKDSVDISTSGSLTQNPAGIQEPQPKCLQCNQCSLVFKSKVFLFEHLNKVHGLDIDAALTNAGLKHTETYIAVTENCSTDVDNHFECQHCDFTALSHNELNEHEKQCRKELGVENGITNQVISETLKTEIIFNLKKEAEGEKQTSSVNPTKSTSNATCTTSSSKDLKTYKRPQQTISKYLVASTGVKHKPPVLSGNCTFSLDGTKETLILQESPSNSNPNSSGVFKVTAVPTIDITKIDSTRFLMMDPFPGAKSKPAKPQGQLKETHLSNVDKRPKSESSGGPPAKKAKSDKESTKRSKSASEIKQQPLSNAEFSFEFSEDEEERMLEDTDTMKVYICKHCDFSAVGIRALSTHYQSSHLHVRYTAAYLQDPSDQSATFRCLKCPTEFSHVTELKKHYTENHPEMPDPLEKQSHNLTLVFKCFVCPFTTNASKALKKHYKAKHATHTVENSLVFYRYLASGQQEGDESQLNESKMIQSPEKNRENSPEKASAASRETTRTPSPQHPTSTGADVALYQCNNCEFRHKSVVVMHVHYQKSHPDEAVSIDTIKQLARVSSLRASDRSPDSVIEKSRLIEGDSDSSESRRKDKESKKVIKLVLRNPVHKPDFQPHSKSPTAVNLDAEEDSSTRQKTPAKQNQEMSSDTEDVPNSSPKELFYCKVCSYSSTNIASVVGHHNKKHYEFERTDIEEISSFSVEMQKKKLRHHVSQSTTPSDSRASKRVDVRSVNKSQHEKESNPYACPENLFYCQRCNFANVTAKGVLNHQAKIHSNLKLERECVLKHTSLMCDQIRKSKSQGKGSSSRLPLPIMSEAMVNPLFCHLCNFRSISMEGVLKHYCTRHPMIRTKSEQIRSYSSKIREKIAETQLKTPENQGIKNASLVEKGNKKKTQQLGRVSDPPVVASQTQRTLKCRKCLYKTQHVYLLKRHVWQIHKMHHTVTEVLRMCYKEGSVQAGYHCEMCVFSHKTAEAVLDHYREKHPKQPSLEYIITRLYVGPESIKIKKKKPQSDSLSGGDVTDDSLPSQSSGQNDTKTYSCKACSFKSDSAMNMSHHYRAVHPWSVKEDGSVLDVIHSKKPGSSRQFEDQSDLYATFETYQEPLEFDNSLDSAGKETKSSKKFKCQLCPARFSDTRHLRSHLSLIHNEDASEGRIQTSVHVFKCPHCTYVNTNHHGVLTHCQMMHPGLESSPNSLLLDKDHLNNMKSCLKKRGQALRLSGYMCKSCPQIYATLGKLNKHCRKNHNEVQANSVTAMPKLSSISKNTQVKIRSNHGFLSKSSLLRSSNYVKIKCQHCAYKSTTKIGMGRHMLLYHSDASVAKGVDPPYKCALCPNSYFRKKRLGNHYITKHGRESFTKFFIPLKKQLEKKSWSTYQDVLSAQHGGNSLGGSSSNTTSGQNKVMVFMCPYCSYVNASFHGVLTHCQMRHPDFTVRADQLKSVEILKTDMVSGSKETSSVARGFRCKKCLQIHASMKKLKIHLERNHGPSEATTSKLIIKIKTTKKQPDYEFQHSVLEAFALKNDAPAESIPETNLSHQLETPQIKHLNTVASNKERLYKCHICSYTACYRRYLQSHYRKYHKIDVVTTFKLLQKYNKRKPSKDSNSSVAQSEESVKCKLCPDSTFKSSELLLDHLRTAHNSDQILDFTILSRGSKRTTGLYKCSHCNKQLNGIKKMCYHLDRHREMKNMSGKTVDTEDFKTITSDILMIPEEKRAEQAEVPVRKAVEDLFKGKAVEGLSKGKAVEDLSKGKAVDGLSKKKAVEDLSEGKAVEELSEVKETPVETTSLPTSPLPSPTKSTEQEQPDEDSTDDVPTCKRCGRTFMSLKGLRSHERSHEALAAIKKHTLPSSISKSKINRYIIYKPGTTKPFVCSFCSYRTNVMVLWRRHFMKNHQDVIANPEENEDQDEESVQSDTEPHNSSEECSPELDEKSQKNKRSQYSEPPDVQRQLNQYNLIAQTGASFQAAVKENMVLESSVLYCDLCNFNTEHLSSIRRHYLNRHGKKMLKCKDCSFYSGSRKTLETHMEMGHSVCQSEPTHQKDLCCPFCLYQTKNKNSMIDHIILHREERLVPIEVRRSKLSRYLEGIVFRCHNCTFTCGSAENLHLHMMKHDDIKPYKCRLCFFDCTRLSDLEAHLSEKHQVVRNHELVGQVSLDQLEARVGRMPGYEEEPLSDPEPLISNKTIIKTEEIVPGYDAIPEETQAYHPEENDLMEKVALKMEDDTDESMLSDLQNENAKLVALKLELDQQEQAVTGFLPEHRTDELVDQSVCGGKKSEDCNSPEKEQSTTEKLAQPIPGVSEASIPEMHTTADQGGEVEKTLEGDSNFSSVEIMKEKKSPENNTKTQFEEDILTLGLDGAQFKVIHVEGSGVVSKEDAVAELRNTELRDLYGEMPVLENEYFKKEMDSPGCCKEEDQSDHPEQSPEDEFTDQEQDECDGIKDADTPHVTKGELKVTDSSFEKHCPLNTEDKQFTCDLCGRNLMNSSDLQHHVVRHGL
ncbi:zinc finger protein 462-like [Halichoeres trimaculatus]|uniref:zinc finger protein 462-like n=1 Tax=Halichoeres trimaculatus TaxID=147232 RepID=UPI003D9F3B31